MKVLCFITVQNSGTYQYTAKLAENMTKYVDVAITPNSSKRKISDNHPQGMIMMEIWGRNVFSTFYGL